MRKLLLPCLLILSAAAYGQNWRPFRTGQVHGYAFAADFPTFLNKAVVTVRVQAPQALADGDTVWRFSRALMPGDTAGCGAFNIMKLRPVSPFGSEVRYNASGARFYVWDSAGRRSDSVLLAASLSAGQSYASGRHTLQYVGTDYQPIAPGFSDSVRTYRLDTSTVLWSKDYGIVRMPVMIGTRGQMQGTFDFLQTRQPMSAVLLTGAFGPPLPTAESLLPYHVGDTLGYRYTSFVWIVPLGQRVVRSEDDVRQVVRSREVDTLARTLRITYTEWRRTHSLAWGPLTRDTVVFSGFYTSTETYDLGVTYQTGYADSSNNAFGYLPFQQVAGDTILGITRDLNFSGSEQTNCFGTVIDGGGGEVFYPGLGFFNGTYTAGENQLTCWNINGSGVPCGSILTSISAKSSAYYRLAQQPVTTQLGVISPTPLRLTLQDLQGRTVAEGHETRTLSTQSLPAGLYLLKAQDRQGHTGILRVVRE